jgi:hypothetical protein
MLALAAIILLLFAGCKKKSNGASLPQSAQKPDKRFTQFRLPP